MAGNAWCRNCDQSQINHMAGLDEAARGADPLALLQAHPTLLKRPVIVADGTSYVGWSKDVQAQFGP